MTRTSLDAADRIEAVLDHEAEYDFVTGDDDLTRRTALRDLLTDVLHAADEWGYDIEQLGRDALEVVAEENQDDDDADFVNAVTATLDQLSDTRTSDRRMRPLR